MLSFPKIDKKQINNVNWSLTWGNYFHPEIHQYSSILLFSIITITKKLNVIPKTITNIQK